jgi:hypothetical protein
MDEDKLVKFVNESLFANAKRWKFYYAGDKHATWMDDIKWYKGMQWAANRPKNKSSVFFNRLFSTIQKELPFMTDRRPKIYVNPVSDPSDKPFADIFQRIIETAWVNRDMERKLPESVLHAKQVGTAFLRPFWNTELADGLGDIDCECVDPLEVFPFAYSSNLKDAEGMIWARWVSLGYIKKNYPDAYSKVKENLGTMPEEKEVPDRAKDTNRGSETTYSQVTDTLGTETHYLPGPMGSAYDASDLKRVLLIKCFMRDDAEEGSDREDKTVKELKVPKLKYPNGRVITLACGVLLEDEAFAFQHFPGMIDYVNYCQPGEFWGMSDITQIKEGQKELNKLNAMVIDAIRRDVYRQKFLSASSGINIDDYVVTDDSIYETNVPNPVQETGAFSLPAQVLAYPSTIETAIQTTSGTIDYSPPTSGDLPSGRSLQELQEISQIRLRQKIRNMEYAIRMLGLMWLEMIRKNYTETRIMRLFNSNLGKQEYVYIFNEPDPEQAEMIRQQVSQEIVQGTEQQDPQTGQPVPGTGEPKYQHILNMADIKGEFDLVVATGSTVSVSQVASFEQSMALFKMGVIDARALLESADYPQKEDIMKRMSQQQQQSAEMAKQQAMLPLQVQQMKSQTEIQKKQMDMQDSEKDRQDDRIGKIAELIGGRA